MDLDNFDFNKEDARAAERRREERLLADEVPLDMEGADDCGDACKI